MASDHADNISQAVESTQLINVDRDHDSPFPRPAGRECGYKFSPGEVLANRFTIIQFLGRGGMGEVYEAADRLLQGVSIALKTVAPSMAETAGAQERFESEVLLARQIAHPNVCPIYDICYHDDERGRSWFLSMKLLRGETLAARLNREKRLAVGEAIRIIRQMGAALEAAHGEGIIHGDIKPANIMLEGAGAGVKAIVMDFGLARKHERYSSVSKAPQCAGTPGYFAPELLAGEPATSASDLYAFGVVLREILTGEKPPVEGVAGKGAFETEIAPQISPLVRGLITDLLANEPRKRRRAFARAQVLLEDEIAEIKDCRSPRLMSRRRMLGAAAAAGCALAGSVAWEWREITDALLHPLPRKRFVALVSWPPTDGELTPMMSGVVDALERELSRAEAFDRDLLVLASPARSKDLAGLMQIQDALGVNLLLAASAESRAKQVHLSLKILEGAFGRVLRQKALLCSLDELAFLPGKAVRLAAELLGIGRYVADNARLRPGTQSAAAYQAFQAAEASKRQPNDTGLEAAIEQYKTAVERDDHYALAHARLATAYCRLYGLRREPAALDLAQANGNTALDLDKNSVEGHLALGFVLDNRGHKQAALVEMEKAHALDPGNARVLIWQAQVYSELNQLAKAEELFGSVLKARPNYWLAYNELGEVLNKDGKYEQALEAYRTAHLAQPKNALPLYNVGEVLLKLGRVREGKESFEKSLALKPIAWAASGMADALRAEGKNGEALVFGQRAAELDPSDEQNWLQLGECYSILPNHRKEATQAYLRAGEEAERYLQMDPTDGPMRMRLALSQAKAGRMGDALANVKGAESAGAIELNSQIFKAQILELAKERESALAVLAGCFQKGATTFQIASIPDLQSLREDHRYLAISHSKRPQPSAGQRPN